jgi:hypothetical protein
LENNSNSNPAGVSKQGHCRSKTKESKTEEERHGPSLDCYNYSFHSLSTTSNTSKDMFGILNVDEIKN